MSMFNRRSEVVAAEPLSGLPAGFDVEGSESFVPEVLRPYWPAGPGFVMDALLDPRMPGWARDDVASDRYLELEAAGEEGRTEMIPQYWGDSQSGWLHDVPHGRRLVFLQRMAAIDEETLPKPNQPHEVPGLQRDRWIHLVASEAAANQLRAVQEAERRAVDQAAAEARWKVDHTCQLCEDTAESVTSVVVTAGGDVALVDPDCQALLVAHRVARLAGRVVGGRSLAERAEAWLDNPPARPAGPAKTMREILAEREAEAQRRRTNDPKAATVGDHQVFGLTRVQW